MRGIAMGGMMLRATGWAIACATMVTAAAHGKQATPLAEPLRALLVAAAESENEADFADAARIIALTADAAAILAAAAALDREDDARAALAGETESEAAAEDERPVQVAGWRRGGPIHAADLLLRSRSETWVGRASLGVRLDSGNSDREDYLAGLEFARELEGVGRFTGRINYAYSEVDGAVGRDQFLAEARGERNIDDRFTAFMSADYEQDALSSYTWTAFLGAGLGYRVIDRDRLDWIVRAGPGLRIIDEPGPGLEPAAEVGSGLNLALTESINLVSESTLLYADRSRADQLLSLTSGLGGSWAIELRYRYRHEFEPEPGFEEGDSRTDVSIVREF